jgi:hypothetical protein
MQNSKATWSKNASNAIRLGASAQAVVALRMATLARGDAAARREGRRMVEEKIKTAFEANADAARRIVSGKALQVPARTLAPYQKHIGNNLRRLLKKV